MRPLDLNDFRRGVSPEEVERIIVAVFGAVSTVTAVRELSGGMYNSTYLVETTTYPEPVVLRVAPEQDKQFTSEWQLMRNEYVVQPHLTAALNGYLPRVIVADWSHEVIDRDYMVLSLLAGVPAAQALNRYPRATWAAYFEQMGELARRVHTVTNDRFGSVVAPVHDSWSDAFQMSLRLIGEDSVRCGLNSAPIDQARSIAEENADVLNQVGTASLLTGDLWTPNVMLDPERKDYPQITGIVDLDRVEWGDPLADWVIWMARKKPNTERDAFWLGYGALAEDDPAVIFRLALYSARHHAAVRLERFRLDATDVADGTLQLERSVEALRQIVVV